MILQCLLLLLPVVPLLLIILEVVAGLLRGRSGGGDQTVVAPDRGTERSGGHQGSGLALDRTDITSLQVEVQVKVQV